MNAYNTDGLSLYVEEIQGTCCCVYKTDKNIAFLRGKYIQYTHINLLTPLCPLKETSKNEVCAFDHTMELPAVITESMFRPTPEL